MASLPQKIWAFLCALGVNFVPLHGFFSGGWSPATTLGVYWFENVAAALLVAVRIALQSWLAPRRGHRDYEPSNSKRDAAKSRGKNGSLLAYFLPMSLLFSFGHGVLLAGFLFVTSRKAGAGSVTFDGPELTTGCAQVLAFLLANFAVDLWGLRDRPFAWIERLMSLNLSRILLVHCTIVFGMIVVALTGRTSALIGMFGALKALADFSGILTSRLPTLDAAHPPPWFGRFLSPSFRGIWLENQKDEIARRARNEMPLA